LLFNFRKQELAKETSLDEVSAFVQNPLVIQALGFAALLSVVLYINVWSSRLLADQELQTARTELQKAFSETFPGVPTKTAKTLTTNPEQLKKFIQQKSKELEQKIKMLSKDQTPMLSRVLAVSATFGKEVKVDVNTLSIDDRSLSIEGALYQGDLSPTKAALEQIPWLKEISLTNENQRFTIRAGVTGR
jgi:hypothetical protein